MKIETEWRKYNSLPPTSCRLYLSPHPEHLTELHPNRQSSLWSLPFANSPVSITHQDAFLCHHLCCCLHRHLHRLTCSPPPPRRLQFIILPSSPWRILLHHWRWCQSYQDCQMLGQRRRCIKCKSLSLLLLIYRTFGDRANIAFFGHLVSYLTVLLL